MHFSTSLVLIAAIVINAFYTVTVSATPYGSRESHSPTALETRSTDIRDSTNPYQITKRMPMADPQPTENPPVRPKRPAPWDNAQASGSDKRQKQEPPWPNPPTAPQARPSQPRPPTALQAGPSQPRLPTAPQAGLSQPQLDRKFQALGALMLLKPGERRILANLPYDQQAEVMQSAYDESLGAARGIHQSDDAVPTDPDREIKDEWIPLIKVEPPSPPK
ncbi:hypothetical protein BC835DRAFT_1413663 [Cytidiella melzeri]|nr:hypothetical protein BC835DRAFT_1413663 [Cytidiella melzeri]